MKKVLVLSASPLDQEPLRLDEEARDLDEKLRLVSKPTVEVSVVNRWAVRTDQVQEAILKLIRRLRAAGANLPIVAITGTYAHAELERAGDLGAQVVLRKPIGLRELAETLRGLLNPAEP